MPELPVACTPDRARAGGPARRRAGGDSPGSARRPAGCRTGSRSASPPSPTAWPTLATFIDLERRCCAFLRFRLTVEPGEGPIWLELTGPPGTREFLAAELVPAAH